MVRVSSIGNINNFFKKSTTIEKVFYFSIVIIIIFVIPYVASRREGFNSRREFVIRRGYDIYDDFYVDVYDNLLYDEFRNNYEISRLIEETKLNKKSVIADIGCATGHTVGSLAKFGYNVKGIDFSKSLITKAKENYPDALFEIADIRNAITFQPVSLTHITCFYFTIYMIKHKRRFFDNCFQWLMPGGYLVLHLVDRNNFDPILPVGNVFTGVDPQKYSNKRITSTAASFENHDYTANFDIKGDDAYLIETFKSKNDGSIRKNEHHMYMPTQLSILAMARDAGFIIISKSDMKSCQHENQFIYVLQKPF